MTEIRAESIWVVALAEPLRVSVLRRMLQVSAAPEQLFDSGARPQADTCR